MIALINNEKQSEETTNSIISGIEKKYCESEWIGIGGKKVKRMVIDDENHRQRRIAQRIYYNTHKKEIKQRNSDIDGIQKKWVKICSVCGNEMIFESSAGYYASIRNNTLCQNCYKPGNYIDITGKTFNRWTVLKRINGQAKNGCANWLCKCSCGKEDVVDGYNLREGLSKSCGCYHKEQVSKKPFEWLFNVLKYNAKDANRACTLTYDDFVTLTKITNCHYCDEVIKWKAHTGKDGKMAYYLDRMDNNIGYIKENCVVCCTNCNRIKSNKFTYDEMIRMGEVLREIKLERIQHIKC